MSLKELPRNPTMAMKEAAVRALSNPTVENPEAAAWDAVIAYKAMFDAADPPVSKYQDRLDHLAALQDGWHDGSGKSPSNAAVSAARALTKFLDPTEFGIFPTEDGGILIEPGERNAPSFEVDKDGKITTEIDD